MYRPLFLMLLLFSFMSSHSSARANSGADVSPGAFEKVLLTAIEDPAQALSMDIECTNEQGIRSLQLYPQGVAIWNQQVQVTIDEKTRKHLLNELLNANFPSFDTHYGGKANSGRIKAPNIVMCSIEVQTGGLEKASYQDVNGDRSAIFLQLAAKLLDSIEPLAEHGVKTSSMSDALGMLQQGRLAPQVFVLRVMHLPANTAQAGAMIRIEAGQLSRRNYQPGIEVGDWVTAPLASKTFDNVIQQLIKTGVWSLPTALPSKDTYQVSITVLNHNVLIRSRPLNNPQVKKNTTDGNKFTALADSLLSLKPRAQKIQP